jgi:FKBP-type peptidyl-prolyl cis-trans isomerase
MKRNSLFCTGVFTASRVAWLRRLPIGDFTACRGRLALRRLLLLCARTVILTTLVALFAIGQDLAKPAARPAESAGKTPASEAKAAINAKTEGEAFLATNATAEGVTVLPDGLQYRIIRTGSGLIPTTNDLIFIKYCGRLIAGGEFDHQNHFLTRSNGGIKGLQEALQRMKVGSRWQIFVPSELAFADEGDPYHHIPPDSALSYDLELLSIARPDDPQVGTGSLGHGLAGEYSERHLNDGSSEK